ncbi:MAG: toll/interleukin-1 receptor domain-containing protein [Pseudanabaenales cyanobacterium]|nr:toll/interleukin-1 receptor domain-containing protein [Pseudanabaenales cyanobacterium]
MSSPGSIFISYRRSDSIGDTGRIYDYLESHFGRDRVFKDVDSIPLGVNFREYLDQEVGRCQVLIAVIGPHWLTVSSDDGNRRLDSPADFVRIEIESALRRKIPVIPLLVNGATMPSPDKLPGNLKVLADWQNIVIRHDPDFRRDVSKLIQGIESLMGQTQSHQATPVHSASTPRSSGSAQRHRLKPHKAIPWLRLATIFGLYGLQGYYINEAGAWAVAWTGAKGVSLVGAEAWAEAVAGAVALVGAGVGIGAVAWTGAGAVTVAVAVTVTWALAGSGAVAVTVARAGVGAVTGAMTVAWTMAGVVAGAGVVIWTVAGLVTVAVAVAVAVAGIKLKERFSATQVFWILWGAATAGLGVGALLGG